MSLPSIAVVNFSNQLTDQRVQEAIRAVNRQVVEDFVPIWGAGRICKIHEPVFDPADINTLANDPVFADSIIYIVDEGLLPGALGFHDLNARDIPFGFVFVLNPQDWTVTLSHEVLELILDPTVNIFVPGPDPRDATNTVLHTYEVCDAVERTTYQIDEIAVSNFLTPSYFTIGEAAGTRNDFLGVGVSSFGVTQGSHIAFIDLPTGSFEVVIGQQAFATRALQRRRFIEHEKVDRPTEEKLCGTIDQVRERKPDALPGVEALSRQGRYEARAKRVAPSKAAQAGQP